MLAIWEDVDLNQDFYELHRMNKKDWQRKGEKHHLMNHILATLLCNDMIFRFLWMKMRLLDLRGIIARCKSW